MLKSCGVGEIELHHYHIPEADYFVDFAKQLIEPSYFRLVSNSGNCNTPYLT